MFTEISLSNYRSIKSARVPLSPFTLLIGANGSGKSNFLHFLEDVSTVTAQTLSTFNTQNRHVNYLANTPTHHLRTQKHDIHFFPNDRNILDNPKNHIIHDFNTRPLIDLKSLLDAKIYALQPERLKQTEALSMTPTIQQDGSGTITVLDALKTGDREDLFDRIETTFKTYIPEIEKLSFVTEDNGSKRLQVREKHLDTPVPFSQLSDGTCLILMMLTIIYQEHPPAVICIEEIDHGLHPRLFDRIIQLCFDITSVDENAPQIIATTHNPYVVDRFKHHESAVLVVEKQDGCTQFTTLADKIQHLDPDEDPLGALWYSGMAGGVPNKV